MNELKDHPKVAKIRNLMKMSKKCKELYTPMIEDYDKGGIELPDLIYQFTMMELNRKTQDFSFNHCKDENKSH